MSRLTTREEAGLDAPAFASYLPRLCRWPVIVATIAASWLATGWRADDIATESAAVWLFRFVAVIGALGAVCALDDPSRDVTQPVVGSRRWLLPARLSVVVLATCTAALPALFVASRQLSGSAASGLAVEVAAMLAFMCAAALTLQRRWGFPEPGQFMVFAVLIVAVLEQATAGRWSLLVTPGPGWEAAHGRWLALGVTSLVICAWQLRDPASRRLAFAVFPARR